MLDKFGWTARALITYRIIWSNPTDLLFYDWSSIYSMVEQANGSNEGTVAELRPPDSPFCDSLSGPISPFARELSEHYGMPVEPILAICLAVAGDALGNGPRLNTGLGAEQPGTNLHVAIAPGANSSFQYVLSHILRPIVAFQRNRFGQYGDNNPALAAQIEQTEKEFHVWREREPYPNSQHRLFYEAELARMKALARPISFLENPKPSHLLAALAKSNGSILVLADAPATQRLLDNVSDLLRAGWHRQPFLAPFLSGHSTQISIEPSFSLICTCSASTLSQLLSDEALLETGLSEQFLTWDLGDAPVKLTDAALPPLRHEANWRRLIDRLLNFSLQPSRIYGLTAEAKSLLFGFANETPTTDAPRLQPEQASRIALILHLCQNEPGPIADRATMLEAMALTRCFASHRRGIVPEPIIQEVASEAAAQVMLDKVRARGRLRPRELFRLYWNQRKTIHQPILDRLLKTGLVAQDSRGFLTVIEPSAPGQQSESESSGSTVGKISLMIA